MHYQLESNPRMPISTKEPGFMLMYFYLNTTLFFLPTLWDSTTMKIINNGTLRNYVFFYPLYDPDLSKIFIIFFSVRLYLHKKDAFISFKVIYKHTNRQANKHTPKDNPFGRGNHETMFLKRFVSEQ